MASKNRIGAGEPITHVNARPIEQRVLRYLDQHGNTSRNRMVPDLASPTSRLGRGIENGSNSFIPAIAARWCRRLVEAGLVIDRRDGDGFHRHYALTHAGRGFVRKL